MIDVGLPLMRAFACVIGIALIAYGASGVWLNGGRATGKAKMLACATWLCPEEFSRDEVYRLQQDSSAARADHALSEFKRALVFDAASAYRWADLAEALVNAHQADSAKYCFDRALAAGPYNPAILFRAANFYFSLAQYSQTMRYLSAVLRNPELDAYYIPAFLTYSRMGVPISEILGEGIPNVPMAAQWFLRYLIDGNQVSDAEATWKWMSERSLSDDSTTGEYLDFLIHNKQQDLAAEIWTALNSKIAPDYRRTTWIFNGGFENAPRPSPLDWHIESGSDVKAARVADVHHDGRWSLQLAFTGTANVDYHSVFQEVLPKPGKWRLQAFVRTEGITTDEGVLVRIYDAAQPAWLDIRTDALTGTHDWTKLERAFEVGPKTTLLRLEIARQPSIKFDNKIEGKAWVDSIRLTPER